MIRCGNIDAFKMLAEIEVNLIPSGVLFLFIEDRTIVWKIASSKFDMDIFKPGTKVSETAIAVRAMKEKRVITEKVPREMYGKRLTTVAIPVVDEADCVMGAFSIVLPRLHPVAESFQDFAPIISELFPEGAFLYMTDLTKIAYKQPSKKFDLPNINIGYELKETDIAYKTIHTKMAQEQELDASRYGVPVHITNYPLYDMEGNERQLVATLGVVVPKANAGKLKGISESLSENMELISKTVEHLALSATKINQNEQNLYESIDAVGESLEQINKVSEFISAVANQSNMLGMNAAIEAARVGEVGKGFAVVANEVRKLSNQSKETVPRIKKITEEIQDHMREVNEKSKLSLQASEEQAAEAQEISASIEQITAMMEELYQLSKEL